MSCQACDGRTAAGVNLCPGCHVGMRRNLRQLASDLTALRLIIAKAEHLGGTTGSRGFESVEPVNLGAVDLAKRTTQSLTVCACAVGYQGSQPTPHALVWWLLQHSRDLTVIADAGAAWLTIRACANELRRYVDLDKPLRIRTGPCPILGDNDEPTCTGTVYIIAPPESWNRPMLALCERCGAEWNPIQFTGLARAIQHREALDARAQYGPRVDIR